MIYENNGFIEFKYLEQALEEMGDCDLVVAHVRNPKYMGRAIKYKFGRDELYKDKHQLVDLVLKAVQLRDEENSTETYGAINRDVLDVSRYSK